LRAIYPARKSLRLIGSPQIESTHHDQFCGCARTADAVAAGLQLEQRAPHNPGTPVGQTNVTVTATSSSISHTFTFNLNVQ
jgi:hypothetical protein